MGLQVEFESFPDVELAFESLAREASGIELLNVRHEHEKNQTFATVFVPDGKLVIFENLISAYLDESKDTKTGPRNHRLLNAISAIKTASMQALWTDAADEFPSADEGSIWWEVWLPVRGDRNATTAGFRERATAQEMQVAQAGAEIEGIGEREAEQVGIEPHAFVEIADVEAEMAQPADLERPVEQDAADVETFVQWFRP